MPAIWRTGWLSIHPKTVPLCPRQLEGASPTCGPVPVKAVIVNKRMDPEMVNPVNQLHRCLIPCYLCLGKLQLWQEYTPLSCTLLTWSLLGGWLYSSRISNHSQVVCITLNLHQTGHRSCSCCCWWNIECFHLTLPWPLQPIAHTIIYITTCRAAAIQ